MKTIYIIKNRVNNKVYVGQTKHYDIRKREHINDLKANRHSNVYLQEDFNKYGINNFKFEILENVNDIDANSREDYYMSYFGGIDTNYVYNAMNSKTKARCMKEKLHNYYVGKSHIEIHGKEKAEHMRKLNSDAHLGKPACYTPNKGKVKTLDGQMVEVTKSLYYKVHKLKNSGYKIKDIMKITNLKYNGIHLILTNSMYFSFKCND